MTIVTQRPKTIVSSEFGPVSLFLALMCRLLRLNYIAWTDDSLDNAETCGRLRRLRRWGVLKCSTRLVVCNPAVRDYYALWFSRQIAVVEILQKESTFRDNLKKSIPIANEYIKQYRLDGKKVVLFVGRLVAVKNLPSLVTAFSRQHDKNTVLIFVGSGELEDQLISLAASSGISDRVIFAGRQEKEKLWAWYLIGGLFVLPSANERFGAVVNEALLAGMPVLCSKFAGASCLIEEGENGSVFNPNDDSGFVHTLSSWLSKTPMCISCADLRESLMSQSYEESVKSFIAACSV